MRRQHHPGQALVIVALFLPVILGLWLLTIELAWRLTTVQAITDALRAANRSAVQTFDYAAFAENRLALADPETVIALARRLVAANLHGINGLTAAPETVADTVQWTVLPSGGTCFRQPGELPLHVPTPALCAVAVVEVRSPLGLRWMIRAFAADTLDLSNHLTDR